MHTRAHPILLGAASFLALAQTADAAAQDVLIRGPTVVTMDARHTVIPDGRVLIRGNRIEAGHRYR
jgi:hypothetical protein